MYAIQFTHHYASELVDTEQVSKDDGVCVTVTVARTPISIKAGPRSEGNGPQKIERPKQAGR